MTSSAEERRMRILIDPGYYDGNMGDVAMLQVAVDRLRRLWPDATLQVITSTPDRLTVHCPQTEPLPARGRHIWHAESCVPARFQRALPVAASNALQGLERRFRRRWPWCATLPLRVKRKFRQRDDADLELFLGAVRKADLVLVSGGGGITDVFCSDALCVMDTLDLAMRRGTPTAMLGQGIGPIQKPDLRVRAQTVLPCVHLIGLRERRAGLPLLQALGVADNRVVTTGDDAIECAYAARPKEFGSGIGVN